MQLKLQAARQQLEKAQAEAAQAKKASESFVADERKLFRGFIGGGHFMTKKGYRGVSLDHLWAKHMMDAFDLDDEELVDIALKSSLADLELYVDGGLYGSPFSIGGFGFYATNQFEAQGQFSSEIQN